MELTPPQRGTSPRILSLPEHKGGNLSSPAPLDPVHPTLATCSLWPPPAFLCRLPRKPGHGGAGQGPAWSPLPGPGWAGEAGEAAGESRGDPPRGGGAGRCVRGWVPESLLSLPPLASGG